MLDSGFKKVGVQWLDITLKQFLEVPCGPLTLLDFFFRSSGSKG